MQNKSKKKQYVIGFLCNISINSNLYSLLITYNNVLGKDDIIPGKSVKFSLNNENNNFEIFLDDERFLYTDSYITIIEIMDYDNLDKNCFLQIDDNIYQNNLFQIFRNKPVYLLHHSNDIKKVIITTGIINSIYDENFYIKFDLNKSSNLLYGPIFDSKSYKIISMYGGNSNKDSSIKLGLFIHNKIKIFEVFKKEKIEEYQQYLNQLKQLKNQKENNDIEKEKNEKIIQKEKDNKEREKNKKLIQKENDDIEKEKNKKIIQKENEKKKREKKKITFKEEITMQYEIWYDEKLKIIYDKNIRIFGSDFVKNNFNLCKIIFNKKKYDLCSFFELKNNKKLINNSIIEIKLIGMENITDLSNMFSDCSKLYSLSDISKYTINIESMNSMFLSCIKLNHISNISNWNTSNVKSMANMFQNCKSLHPFPDISNWDTSKVTDMDSMFYEIKSL